MMVTFDPAKNSRNLQLRGLPFVRAAELDWATAQIREDGRSDYGETRFIVLGNLEDRLHVLCFTPTPEGIRVISFRKANNREVNAYEKQKAID